MFILVTSTIVVIAIEAIVLKVGFKVIRSFKRRPASTIRIVTPQLTAR